MSDPNPTDLMIERAQVKLREQEAAVVETKRFINQCCAFDGRQPIYAENELSTDPSSTPKSITRNMFYGKPLATCVKEILKMRERMSPREATLNELIDALRQGGYDLENHAKDADGQKRGVAISLAKNTVAFHKLPNDDFGLAEWYAIKSKRRTTNGDAPVSNAPTPEKDNVEINSESKEEEEENEQL